MRLRRVVVVRDDERHVDAVREQHAQAARADVVIREHDGAGGMRAIALSRSARSAAASADQPTLSTGDAGGDIRCSSTARIT